MLTIRVHKNIYPENDGWFGMYGEESFVFSLEEVQRIFAEHPEEQDVRLDIHSNGGVVSEALAIYDFLRTSGRNIHTNIEGSCHSAAVVLLLAAPAQNRTANAHASALIHKVSGGVGGTVDDVEACAEYMRTLQDQVIGIYADRTNLSREEAERILNEQKERNTDELLEWGFIARINPYITNYVAQNQPTKNTMTNIKEKLTQMGKEIVNLLGIVPQTTVVVNYDFVDKDDNVVFSTEGETADLSVGMEAKPDGVFTLADGRTVTIEGGKIAKIEEAPKDENEPTNEAGEGKGEEPATAEPTKEPTAEETIANLRKELEDAKASLQVTNERNTALESKLTEAHNLITEAAKGIKSNVVIGSRIRTEDKNEPTKEELKAAMRAKNNKQATKTTN